MSDDWEVEISPSGLPDQHTFLVRGKTVSGGQDRWDVPRVVIGDQDAIVLRRGDADQALVDRLTAAIDGWVPEALSLLLTGQMRTRAAANAQDPTNAIRLLLRVDERIEDQLSDVPFELFHIKNSNLPFVLSNHVSAMVHLLAKTGPAKASPAAHTWPMRVLLVRANPMDLGGAVPEALPLRDHILRAAGSLGQGLVQVDLLSREPGAQGLPTWAQFRKSLGGVQPYDMIVYLGHGDRRQADDVAPISELQFEEAADGGIAADKVDATQLTVQLHRHPVPVVILAGCLTANQVAQQDRAKVQTGLPNWIRGSQGVAQSLIGSESGVQLAVGMRYKIDSEAAIEFLKAFFDSLFDEVPGDVESAVLAGRVAMHGLRHFPPDWSAPVVFRTHSQEPTFEFMRTPPAPSIPPSVIQEIQKFDLVRAYLWQSLAEAPLSQADQAHAARLARQLQSLDQQLVAAAHGQASVIMPRLVEGQPQQVAEVVVQLHDTMEVTRLEGEILIDGVSVTVADASAAPRLQPAGYRCWFDETDRRVGFRVERLPGSEASLAAGDLFTLRLSIAVGASGLYPVTPINVVSDPKRPIWPANNVLVVRPP
jgi:hypothetical protein